MPGALDEASDESFPASDPPSYTRDPEAERNASPDAPRHEPERLPADAHYRAAEVRLDGQRHQDADPVGRDRRDHLLHEHEQPDRDGRRRSAGAERGGPRPRDEAVGEDLTRPRISGGDRLPACRRPDGAAQGAEVSTSSGTGPTPGASATPDRWPSRSRRPSKRTILPRWRSSPATATSRAASTRWPVRATSHRRRCVVAFALAGRIDIDLTTEPIGTDRDGKPVMLDEIWPPAGARR